MDGNQGRGAEAMLGKSRRYKKGRLPKGGTDGKLEYATAAQYTERNQ